MTKPKTPFYIIEVTTKRIRNLGPPEFDVRHTIHDTETIKYKVTDHIIDSLNLSFSIVDKDEYVYISHSEILSFKLIGSKKHQKDLIKLKEDEKE